MTVADVPITTTLFDRAKLVEDVRRKLIGAFHVLDLHYILSLNTTEDYRLVLEIHSPLSSSGEALYALSFLERNGSMIFRMFNGVSDVKAEWAGAVDLETAREISALVLAQLMMPKIRHAIDIGGHYVEPRR